MKKITVIIPTFNCERFIESAIESAQAQIRVELDIIVIDDGSLDKTKDIVMRLVQKYSNICFVENMFNKGAAGARNTGIFLSKECDYFAFLDADDRWEDDKLYKQTKLMEKTASKLSYSAYYITDQNGNVTGLFNPKSSFSKKRLLFTCDIGCSTVVVDQKVMLRYKFPELPKEDYALWLKMAYKDDISCVVLSEPLMYYRVSEGQISSNKLLEVSRQYKVLRTVTEHYWFQIFIYISVYILLGSIKHYFSYRKCQKK